jgi:hypothetical protein
MILKMTAEEYDGVIKYLLSLPMSRADFPMLEHLYAGGGIPEVLGETSKELRARVAMNAVKAKCDENTQKEVIENESTGSMRRIPASVRRIS